MTILARIVTVATVFVMAAGAFLYTKVSDEMSQIRGGSDFTIVDYDRTFSGAMAYKNLQEVAESNEINIYKISYGDNSDDRIIYGFIGDQFGHVDTFPGNEYVAFDPATSTILDSTGSYTTRDIRGLYTITGPEVAAENALRDLGIRGFDLITGGLGTQSTLVLVAQSSHLTVSVIAAIICLILTVAYMSLSAAKQYSIEALHGFTFARSVCGGLRKIGVDMLAAAGVVLAIATVLLYFYNGLTLISRYVVVFVLGVAVVVLLAGLANIVGALAAAGRPERRFLAGARPTRQLVPFSWAAKSLILVMLLAIASSTAAAAYSLYRQEERASDWRLASNLYAVSFSSAMLGFTAEEETDFDRNFRQLVNEFESDGDAIVSVADAVYQPNPVDTSQSVPTMTVSEQPSGLIVNRNFLAHVCVKGLSGNCVAAEDLPRGDVYILIPESMEKSTSSIINAYADYLAFQQSLGAYGAPPDFRIDTVPVASDQIVFTFGSPQSSYGSHAVEPIILVVDASDGILSDNFYAASASQQRILFADHDAVVNAIADDGISDYAHFVYSIKDQSLQYLRDLQQQLSLLVMGLVGILIASIITTFFVVSLYCDNGRRKHYIQYTTGWSFWRRHRKALTAIAAGYLAVTGIVWLTWTAADASLAPVLLGIIAAEILLIAVVLAIHESRSRTTLIKRP